jgi:hypothetical protein
VSDLSLNRGAVNVFSPRPHLAKKPHAVGAVAFQAVLALVIALAFEFVNGFHDTANAVTTVIYTHSLLPAGWEDAGGDGIVWNATIWAGGNQCG